MTNESSDMSALEAMEAKFKDSVISSKKLGTERYEYLKNKKSQADGTTANVVIIHDKGTGTHFTISVNVAAIEFKGKVRHATEDRLPELQAIIGKFLEGIHEEL